MVSWNINSEGLLFKRERGEGCNDFKCPRVSFWYIHINEELKYIFVPAADEAAACTGRNAAPAAV